MMSLTFSSIDLSAISSGFCADPPTTGRTAWQVNQFVLLSINFRPRRGPEFFWYCFTSQGDAVEEECAIRWQLTARSDWSEIIAGLGQGIRGDTALRRLRRTGRSGAGARA